MLLFLLGLARAAVSATADAAFHFDAVSGPRQLEGLLQTSLGTAAVGTSCWSPRTVGFRLTSLRLVLFSHGQLAVRGMDGLFSFW